MNEQQVNGIWLVETPAPEPPATPEPTGPKCWQCEKRLPGVLPGASWWLGAKLWGENEGWSHSTFTCRHEPAYYCPEHDYTWMRENEIWSKCPTCGRQEEYC